MTRAVLYMIVFVTFGLSTALAQTGKKSGPEISCPRYTAIEEFKKVAMATGTIDTVHVESGIVVIAASGTNDGISAIQKAAKKIRFDQGNFNSN